MKGVYRHFRLYQHCMNSIEPCESFHTETIGNGGEKGEPNYTYPAVDIVNIPRYFQNSCKIFWTNNPQTLTVPPQ
jgi:hypothetical protein